MSDTKLRSLIDQHRLQRAMILAKSQVTLILDLLEMLYNEIIRGRQQLKDFATKYEQGLVHSDKVASVQWKLQQTREHLNDFEDRQTRDLGPLNLQNQLIPNPDNAIVPQLSASLVIQMPVIFNRMKLGVIANTVHLCWEVAGQLCQDAGQQFEICIMSLYPTTVENEILTCICQSYKIQDTNLTPDWVYQFSVRRVDAPNLVYGVWTDVITLRTNKGQNAPC